MSQQNAVVVAIPVNEEVIEIDAEKCYAEKITIHKKPTCRTCQKPQKMKKSYGVSCHFNDPEILQEINVRIIPHKNCLRLSRIADELLELEIQFSKKRKELDKLYLLIFQEE